MKLRPRGRPVTVDGLSTDLRIRFTDQDRRYVESMCRIMNVSYSEFFRMLLKTLREEMISGEETKESN